VPQSITLLDESIAFNVAFERTPDEAAVRGALASANLATFVDALPAGAATRVGENGLRLSGGQRQRLGIARALYRNPAILVFDEATSSLDSATEALLVAEVDRLRANMSVVVVAHRLSTVRSCDRIYVIESGRIAASGSHAELMTSSPEYRALATGQLDESSAGG
jgi:ABC-type multidrug transport system fused ATPase/permease subunit